MKFGINYNTGVVGVDPDARGVNRLVVGPASTELSGQLDQLSAFADRLALR